MILTRKIRSGWNSVPSVDLLRSPVTEPRVREWSIVPGSAAWKRANRLHRLCLTVPIIGIVACAFGAIVGICMASHATAIPCPDTSFQDACSAHHHAGEGAAIVAAFTALACIVVVVGYIGRTIAASQQEA